MFVDEMGESYRFFRVMIQGNDAHWRAERRFCDFVALAQALEAQLGPGSVPPIVASASAASPERLNSARLQGEPSTNPSSSTGAPPSQAGFASSAATVASWGSGARELEIGPSTIGSWLMRLSSVPAIARSIEVRGGGDER